MTTWRMAFRVGDNGYEMWPVCQRHGVAAIAYETLYRTDLSKFKPGEPRELWKQLASSQASSLKKVAYEMAPSDVIYVKKGPLIVGRGVVTGPYAFRLNPNIIEDTGDLWPHQVPVAWETDFPSFKLLLGAEQHAVLKLRPDHIAQLNEALASALAKDSEVEASENDRQRRTIAFRKRNRSIIAAKKRASQGVCEACGIRFASIYQMPPGKDCLHVHHRNPLSEHEGVVVTSLADLVEICPNCHAVVHAFTPALKIEELRQKIR